VKIKDDKQKKNRLVDLIPLSKQVYVLYSVILIVAVFMAYLAVVEYFRISVELGEGLNASVTQNSVETFADGIHPYIITVKLASTAYTTEYSSSDYVTNYTAFAILPRNAFSTEFNITVTASGATWENRKEIRTMTKEEPKVMFKVN
jgi:uncharacterized membrane protein